MSGFPAELEATRNPAAQAAAGWTGRAAELSKLKRLAWLLDNSIPLPGGIRIGAESLIGLIPGIGDAVGALVSSYILAQAIRLGASTSVLLRMALNVGLDLLVGAIPVLGDLFDMVFKANQRNAALLDAYAADRGRITTRSHILLIAVFVGALVAAGLIVWGLLSLFAIVWRSVV